jgi:hypothetical protein
MSDAVDLKKIKPIDDSIQKKLSADVCSLLAMSQLESQGFKLSFENITMMAYGLFPSKFSLPNYPGYPDSHKIHESVNLHMQYTKGMSRHWAEGNPRQGYRITEQGRRELRRYQWVLGRTTQVSGLRRLSEGEQKVLELIKSSDDFKKYLAGKSASINDEDICFMLRFPVGEDPRKASQALGRALEAAEKAMDKDITNLLHEVQSSHSKLFSYTGGSWKRRSA